MNVKHTNRGGAGARWVLVLAVLLMAAMAVWQLAGPRRDAADTAVPLVVVQRGPLVISVTESGTIQNRERAVVKSQVEGTATILFLVPEGIDVRKGDLLVELDSSRLHDSRAQQQITVLNSEAAFIRARENLAVTKSQAESDLAKAELALKFAELDLTKYLEGEYPRELQKAESDITIAKEELARAQEKLTLSKPLVAEGYMTQSEMQANELAAKRAQIALSLAETNLSLLKKYSHQRNLDQRKSDLAQAKQALIRSQRKAAADLVQAEADLKARESEHERQKARLAKIDQQILKCKIEAPVDGMVVYATTGKANWRGNVEPLAEGQTVREREELIFMPTTSAMMADIKIHEASLRKIREGMPVRVKVDALPGREFWGRVGKIALLPDAQSAWLNPDLKVYSTEIYIDRDTQDLRPGMTCRAEIIVEQHEETLFLPVQCVVRVGGKSVVYLPGPNGPEPREVEVGYDNNRMIRVLSGLAAGDRILLAPPLAPSELADEPTNGGAATVQIPAGTTQPAAAETNGQTEEKPLDAEALRAMSREERRKATQNLSPEQLRKLRSTMGGGRTRPPRGAQGGGE
jgi:HlyD family secretion protein